MIPSTVGFLPKDFVVEEQPSKTYKMNIESDSIYGITDGIEAVRQFVFKTLNTERYEYLIYSWNYGVELADLFGEPVSYVCPELERRIKEVLLCDKRIKNVSEFSFDIEEGIVQVSFKVTSIFGEIQSEKEVKI